ncbi:MAG: GH36 C-terminal domain-containing protein, partial [Candidatus Hydrogenedentes bacterium]|nr:GH36 C-terminal domain-containing protein [Candidatus Hydrogenedentota bacterium]
LATNEDSDTFLLRPRGLDSARNYRVTFDSTATSASMSGTELMMQGLPIRLENAAQSELLLFDGE